MSVDERAEHAAYPRAGHAGSQHAAHARGSTCHAMMHKSVLHTQRMQRAVDVGEQRARHAVGE